MRNQKKKKKERKGKKEEYLNIQRKFTDRKRLWIVADTAATAIERLLFFVFADLVLVGRPHFPPQA